MHVEGRRCEHWVADEGPESRVHVFFSITPFRGKTQSDAAIMTSQPRFTPLPPLPLLPLSRSHSAPRRLTSTKVDGDREIALMSYDFHNVTIGPQVRLVCLTRQGVACPLTACSFRPALML